MSGLVGPALGDVAFGLGLEIALKATVPLAVGLALAALPGSASARHARLTAALAAVPVLALATAVARGSDAAWVGAPWWALAVWAAGAGVGWADLAGCLRVLGRLPTRSGPAGLVRCASIRAPLTAGSRILVPEDFEAWPAPAQSAALAHERAHVRRRDWLVHVGAWLLGAALWFHPLMALARRRLALLAECAADDAVLAEGHNPTAYAELLLRLGASSPRAGLALGRSMVGVRVRRLLEDHRRDPASWRSAGWGAALFLGCGWFAGFAAWTAPAPVPGCDPRPHASAVIAPFDPSGPPPYWSL